MFFLLFSFLFVRAQERTARIWVESAELCPGQVVDLGIYVDLGTDPVALDNFMFYLNIEDTSAVEILTYDWIEQSDGAFMGQPVLSDLDPAIGQVGSLVYNYIEGRKNVPGSDGGKQGVFTCIWVDGSGRGGFLPDPSRPLFKIRVRCLDQKVSRLVFQRNSLAFSTGLEIFGGFYYSFPSSNIGNGQLTAGKGPDKNSISAGEDVYMCVGERIAFNAEGGVSYKWSQVYNPAIPGGYQNEYLTNADTKQPTFLPLSAGPFVYQVAVSNEQGCYTMDTVVYNVSQNYINNTVAPDQMLVDSGSVASFQVAATTASDLYPVKVTLTPDTLFAAGQNVFYLTQEQGVRQVSSLPVREPALVVAHYEDRYCQAQSASRIYVKGVEVSGRIAPFPIYRCGNDTKDKSVQLNLLTSGGSGKFLYNWKVKDLEFGELGAPWIDNPYSRNPWLWYIGRCAVSVDILDMETGQTVTISDTMIYKDWVKSDVRLVLDTLGSGLTAQTAAGPFCENTRLQYKALAVNPGSDPEYHWRVNGIWNTECLDSVFSTTLRKGDSVDVILYSSENCVAEKAVMSNRLSPDIHYPSIMTVYPSNVSDGKWLESCADSVLLSAGFRNAGRNFRLQWWRNERERVYDRWVSVSDPDSGSVACALPRLGFYDSYYCSLSGSDMPCVAFDSVASEVMYLNRVSSGNGQDFEPGWVFNPVRKLEAGAVSIEGNSLVCGTEPFTLRTDVLFLPRDFALAWYRKSGADSVLLGYYAFDSLGELPPFIASMGNQHALYDLAGSWGYGYGSSMAAVRNIVRDGFKLVLNDPDDIMPARRNLTDKDTVFYRVYSTRRTCAGEPHQDRSSDFALPVMPDRDYSDVVLSVRKLEDYAVCPTSTLTLTASCGEDIPKDLRYEWWLTGHLVTDTFGNYDKFFTVKGERGDTLVVHRAYKNITLVCKAVSDMGCGTGFPKETAVPFADWVYSSTPFRIVHNPDTIVCEGAEIRNWAEVLEYEVGTQAAAFSESVSGEDSGIGLKKKAGKSALSGKNSGGYAFLWAFDLDYLTDPSSAPEGALHEGAEFLHRPVSNGSDSTGKGDLADTKGITTYYVKASNAASGCVRYDSVQVLMARAYRVSASIDYLLPAPWCDSANKENTDADIRIEGRPYVKGAQYAVLNIENGGQSPYWQWGLNGASFGGYSDQDTICLVGAPDGDTLWAEVTTGMLTCLDNTVTAKTVLRVAEPGVLYANAPQWAQEGEEILLQACVSRRTPGSPNLSDWLHGFSYSWWNRLQDGSWDRIVSDGQGTGIYGLDSVQVRMPAYAAAFRVDVQDKYKVCPAVSSTLEVATAVPTEVDLKVRDLASGKFVEGFCGDGNGFVLTEGTQGDYQVGTPGRVRLEVYPQNASGKAYVGYYKNGTLIGMGPVGSSPVEDFPDPGDGQCQILGDGRSMETTLQPGDVIGAFYVHDTISIDGVGTHYSPRLEFLPMAPNGTLEVKAGAEVVCPGEEVVLRAFFEDMEGLEDGIPRWQPALLLDVLEDPWQARARVEEETLYEVSAEDSFGCTWTDSVRVYVAEEGEAVPLKIETANRIFCGEGTLAEVYVSLEGSESSLQDVFSQVYCWLWDEKGTLIRVDSGFAPFRLPVKDDWKAVAKARLKVGCVSGLSVSDTLRFESVLPPSLRRLHPLSDTSVCPGSEVEIAYGLLPGDALLEWNSVLALVGSQGLSAVYRVDRDAFVSVCARSNRLASCAVYDTLQLSLVDDRPLSPVLKLTADRRAVCGPEEVTYHLRAENCDTLVWFAQGKEVLRDALSLTRVPSLTGIYGPADSVYVLGIRSARLCQDAVRSVSPVVEVWRVDKPFLEVLTPDTVLDAGASLLLAARASAYDGDEPSLAWFDSEGNLLASEKEAMMDIFQPEVFRVVARQTELGAELPQCFSWDSVRVEVKEVEPEPEPEPAFAGIYLPNTLIPGSERQEDAFLKVYGEGIVEVEMRVYDAKGVLLFDQRGRNAAWQAKDLLGNPVAAGNYACYVRVWMDDGRIVEKQAVVTVVR